MRRSVAPAAIGSGRLGANLGWHYPSGTRTPDGAKASACLCQPRLAPTRSGSCRGPSHLGLPWVGANLGWHDSSGTPDGPMALVDVCQPRLAPTRSGSSAYPALCRPTVGTHQQQISPIAGQLSASAASRVFCINVATVIGPTPPGTGVIQLARWAAASNPTSPTNRPSSNRLIPTSITTAPGFTHSPGTMPGRPTATTRMSALRTACSSTSLG